MNGFRCSTRFIRQKKLREQHSNYVQSNRFCNSRAISKSSFISKFDELRKNPTSLSQRAGVYERYLSCNLKRYQRRSMRMRCGMLQMSSIFFSSLNSGEMYARENWIVFEKPIHSLNQSFAAHERSLNVTQHIF